jgi:glycine cleavage system aminomethyltransferase T
MFGGRSYGWFASEVCRTESVLDLGGDGCQSIPLVGGHFLWRSMFVKKQMHDFVGRAAVALMETKKKNIAGSTTRNREKRIVSIKQS